MKNLVLTVSTALAQPRLLILFCLMCVLGLSLSSMSVSRAQDAADEFGAPAAAEPAAAPANNANAQPDAAAENPKKNQSLLLWVAESLGWPYVIAFLFMSFVFVSLFVMCVLAFRRDALLPQELVDGFEAKLNEKEFQAAYDLARADESVLGQVLSAGLAKLSKGTARRSKACKK